jgi:hypothetical protein
MKRKSKISNVVTISVNDTGFFIKDRPMNTNFQFSHFYKDDNIYNIQSREEFQKIMTEIAQQDILKDLSWPGKIGENIAWKLVQERMGFDQFRNINFPDTHHSKENADKYFDKFISAFEARKFGEKKSWLKMPGPIHIKKFPKVDFMNYDAGPKPDIVVDVDKYICGLHTQLDSFEQNTKGYASFPEKDIVINIDPSVFNSFGYTQFIEISSIQFISNCTFNFSLKITYADGKVEIIDESNYTQFNIGNSQKKFGIKTKDAKLQFKLLLMKLLGDGLQPLMAMIFLLRNPDKISKFAASTHDHFLLLKYLILGIQVFFFSTIEETHTQAIKINPDIPKFNKKQKVRYVERFLMVDDTIELAKQRLTIEFSRIQQSNAHIKQLFEKFTYNSQGEREVNIARVGSQQIVINEQFVLQILQQLEIIITNMETDYKSKLSTITTISECELLKDYMKTNYEINQIIVQTKSNITITAQKKYFKSSKSKLLFLDANNQRISGKESFADYAMHFSKIMRGGITTSRPGHTWDQLHNKTSKIVSQKTIGKFNRSNMIIKSKNNKQNFTRSKRMSPIQEMSVSKSIKLSNINITQVVKDLVNEYYDEKDGYFVDTNGEESNLYETLFEQIILYCDKNGMDYNIHFSSIYALLFNYCESINEVIYDTDLENFIKKYKLDEGSSLES